MRGKRETAKRTSWYLDDKTYNILIDYANKWQVSLSHSARNLINSLDWDTLPTTLIEAPRNKCTERSLMTYKRTLDLIDKYKGSYSRSEVLTGLLREWDLEMRKR